MSDSGAFDDAMAHHQAGRVGEAAALYRTILAREPDHADSLHLLGLITVEHADIEAGMALIRRAMAIEPGSAAHCNSLGHGFRRLGRPEDAVTAYRAGVALRPGSAELHNNLATTLRDLGRHQEAVAHYRQAACLAPEIADLWYNLANALADGSDFDETGLCYERAIGLRPGYADALGNYGQWLMGRGRWADAEVQLTEALRLVPVNAATWNNLGVVSQELGRPGAEGCYRNALALDPGLADAHCNLGCLLAVAGQADAAIACHHAAISADPGFGPARLAACMAELPVLYRTQAEVGERRGRYASALETLVRHADARSLGASIGRSQPFFLPYQGQDDRALQALYGGFACRVLAETEPPVVLAPRPAAGERIRVGIVSGFFRDHTLFKLFLEGWLTHLDRSRFEVIGFHTGAADALTVRCAGLCDRFVQGLSSGAAWRDAISGVAPHVLLYPEVGIDPMAGRLAAMRLAPVQCVAWGQPETTGMPTVDYYLSSALMEPGEADRYYTERLVRLPNLGLCYTPEAGEVTLAVGSGPVVFWSGQALYKYLPEYDRIYARIAAELGECTFVFIAFAKSQAVTDAFHARLTLAFADAGLDAARHVVILPALSQSDYMAAVGRADVILDTPGWSGGKSTLDCLGVDPAIVTWPGRFMRGRHTAAILRRIGCEATIAWSEDGYVALAVRLARDPAWRAEVRRNVALGKHLAFGDLGYIRGLEAFLEGAVSEAGSRKVVVDPLTEGTL